MDCGVTIGLLSWAGDINALYVRPTLTVTRKCFGKGKASVVNPIIVWSVEWVGGLLCTLYSALMCRDVGWGQWSDLALAPGAWSAGHWGPGEREHLVRRGHYIATCVL